MSLKEITIYFTFNSNLNEYFVGLRFHFIIGIELFLRVRGKEKTSLRSIYKHTHTHTHTHRQIRTHK